MPKSQQSRAYRNLIQQSPISRLSWLKILSKAPSSGLNPVILRHNEITAADEAVLNQSTWKYCTGKKVTFNPLNLSFHTYPVLPQEKVDSGLNKIQISFESQMSIVSVIFNWVMYNLCNSTKLRYHKDAEFGLHRASRVPNTFFI